MIFLIRRYSTLHTEGGRGVVCSRSIMALNPLPTAIKNLNKTYKMNLQFITEMGHRVETACTLTAFWAMIPRGSKVWSPRSWRWDSGDN